MSDRPSISVIIPAYNRADLIGETLRSLLNQTLPAKEIIMVDDGSTDGTAESAEKEFSVFREQFSGKSKIQNPTFKILRQQNAGPGAARNRGFAESTGEFIHFFDSDDIAAPNKHEVQLQALLESGADIAYGPWVKGRFAPLCEGRGDFSVFSFQFSGFSAEGPVLQARGLPSGDLIKALFTNWSIVPHACLFRRSILERSGGFPEDIWVGEDQLLFLRCLLAGAKVVHTPGALVLYRLGDDPGKLTATGAAQKRHARDWGRFLLKAKKEIEDRRSGIGERQGAALDGEPLRGGSRTERSPSLHGQALDATTPPAEWYAFRLRAYEAWRDLGRFFPEEEGELKRELLGIWKKNRFSGFRFQVSGFVMRKLGGVKFRMIGYREHASFRCSKVSIFVAERCLADYKT